MAQNYFQTDNVEGFSGALTAKLFYTYQTINKNGTWSGNEKTNLESLSKKSGDEGLENTFILIPDTGEFLVNGAWYGLSLAFINNLYDAAKKWFGEDVMSGDEFTTEAFDIDGLVAEFVKAQATKLANEATKAIEIASSKSDESDSAYAPIDIQMTNEEAYDNASEIVSKKFDINIPLDGKTLFAYNSQLTSPVKLEIVSGGYRLYNGVMDNEYTDVDSSKIRIALYYVTDDKLDSVKRSDAEGNKYVVLPNLAGVVDASPFVFDGLAKIHVDEENPHKIWFHWTTSEGEVGETSIDFTDIINFQQVDVDEDSEAYLTFALETDKDSHGDDGEHTMKFTASLHFWGIDEVEGKINAIVNGGLKLKDGVEDTTDYNSYELDDDPRIVDYDHKLVDNHVVITELAKRDKANAAKFEKLEQAADVATKELREQLTGAKEADDVKAVKHEDGIEGILGEVVALAKSDLDEAIDSLDSTLPLADENEWVKVTIQQENGKIVDKTSDEQKSSVEVKVATILDKIENSTLDVDKVENGFANSREVVELVQKVEDALEVYIDNRLASAFQVIDTWVREGAWQELKMTNDGDLVK